MEANWKMKTNAIYFLEIETIPLVNLDRLLGHRKWMKNEDLNAKGREVEGREKMRY
jgi:hypothetical protein